MQAGWWQDLEVKWRSEMAALALQAGDDEAAAAWGAGAGEIAGYDVSIVEEITGETGGSSIMVWLGAGLLVAGTLLGVVWLIIRK